MIIVFVSKIFTSSMLIYLQLGEDRYVLFSLLGKGGFSEVWKAFDLVELCEVAGA